MLTLNGVVVKPTIFPDGTSQVWKLGSISYPSVIEWRFEDEREFIHLLQLYHLVREVTGAEVHLKIPYLPYARQDKQIDDLMTFAIRPFLKALASVEWASLSVFDPHSDIVAEYFPSVIVHRPNIDDIASGYDAVCFPDAGAASRYSTNKPTICGSKVRDQQSGQITSYSVESTDAKRVLVVDDICDGGATFLMLGKCLVDSGISADLYVSHGIFSNGVDNLLSLYGRIITTDSLPTRYSVEVRKCW